MTEPAEKRQGSSLTDYLAAERTLLAWIRTGLALMGFGFVIARFALFLEQLQFAQHVGAARSYGASLWFGTALIAAGGTVNLLAGWHHVRLVRRLERGATAQAHSSAMAVATTFFLALVGLAMAVYLISVRDSARAISANVQEGIMAPEKGNGILSKQSNHSVDETLGKLKSILQAKGVAIFAVVDHSGEAEKAGLKMRPTKLVIFGNPKAGTPLMQSAPSAAIDLPLKILIAEDAAGKVWVSYNSPAYLEERHGFSADLLPNIAVVEALANAAAQ